MMKLDTRSFQRDLRVFAKKHDKGCKRAVKVATIAVRRLAMKKVRQHISGSKNTTGTLLNGIVYRFINGGLTGEVISRAGHSEAFEKGQRPHTIRVKSKRVLAGPFRSRPAGWNVSGKSRSMGYATYGKSVQHPGTHARPFMAPSVRAGQKKLEAEIKRLYR